MVSNDDKQNIVTGKTTKVGGGAPKESLTVIFDTSVLWEERYAENPKWAEFRNLHNFYDVTVQLPRVVIHELVGKRKQEIVAHKRAAESAVKDLGKSLKSLNSNLSTLGFDEVPHFNGASVLEKLASKDGKSEAYTELLAAQVGALEKLLGIRPNLIDWPLVSHEEIVTRCSELKSPFVHVQGKDKGYKDYLFWLSVLETVRDTDHMIAVVTNDNAFYNQESQLHPDLLHDLKSLGGKKTNLAMCRKLSEFIERFVTPYTERDTSFEVSLRKSRFGSLTEGLRAFQSHFDEVLDGRIRDLTLSNFGGSAEVNFSVTSFEPVVTQVLEVRKHPKDARLVLSKVVCRYIVEVETKQIANQKISYIETEKTWLAFECICEAFMRSDETLQAATIKEVDRARLCDMAICRLTVSSDVKGPSLEVFAAMEFAESQTSLQHWELPMLDACLKDFGMVAGFTLKQKSDEKEVYEVFNVPIQIIEKWGYKPPQSTI